VTYEAYLTYKANKHLRHKQHTIPPNNTLTTTMEYDMLMTMKGEGNDEE